MIPIIKSTTQPSDKEAVWIDLSTKPFKIKVFGPDGWTEVNDSSSVTVEIEGLSKAIEEAKKEIDTLNKTSLKTGTLATIDSTSIEEGGNIDLASVYLKTEKAKETYVPLDGYVASEQNFTNALKDKLDGIEEGANETVVDDALNDTSTNPVQNKIVNDAISSTNDSLNSHVGDSNIHVPVTNEAGQVLVSNGDGTSKWATLESNSLLYYGIEFDTTIADPTCTRIGNPEFHKTLPIQSKMRGCLLDDNGDVVKYLNPDTWVDEVRDGSMGQVMVEIPEHYVKFEEDGTKRRVKMSLVPIFGYKKIKKMYVSAYEASIERSTGKLCSVVNEATDYRGGDNNASYDGTYRSFLGRPVTSMNRTAFRTAARKRNTANSSWNCYLYQVHKALFWLFAVEYATLNSQAAFNAELTSEGYRQGGLGAGVSDWSSSDWSNFNGYYPFVPCGHTDTLGNSTGVVAYTAYNADGSELKTSNVPRYRGVENPFGHIWKWTDGINVRISPTEANGGDNLSKVFVCEDPSKLNDTNYNGYKHVGNEARTEGYVKEIIFGEEGEIMPSLVGGGSTQFFCDYHYTNIPTTEALRGVLFGGYANYGAFGGLASALSSNAPSASNARIGSRLCFIPNE